MANLKWDKGELIIPAEHADAANAVMHVVDEDTGGSLTFSGSGYSADGNAPATHYWCGTVWGKDFLKDITKNFTDCKAALTTLAADRGRDMPTDQQIHDWIDNLEIDKPGKNGLVRIDV